mgnify:FL=1
MNKNEIRNFTLKIRTSLHHYFVAQKSQIILNNLSCVLNNERYKNILIFMEIKNEVSISNITKQYKNKNFFIPKTFKDGSMKINSLDKDKLSKNKFGILESEDPNYIDPETLDLINVPGIAFDQNLNRIGYGKGFYDKFLTSIKKNVLKVGVCYDFQLYDKIQSDPDDVKMDLIITEKQSVISNNLEFSKDFSTCYNSNPE